MTPGAVKDRSPNPIGERSGEFYDTIGEVRTGDRVFHTFFGEGTVAGTEDENVRVLFDLHGEKEFWFMFIDRRLVRI